MLQHLNPAQQQAVQTIEGPVMVMAGPGTGKTQVLATRIAYILQQQDIEPSNILALTFTEAAAQNMRQRLLSLVGQAAYQVQVATFHSFGQQILQEYAEFFEISRSAQPVSTIEQYQVMENILESQELDALRPLKRPFFYLESCLKRISELKRENVTVQKYQQLLNTASQTLASQIDDLTKGERTRRELQLAKQTELAVVYSQYQKKLAELKKFDFDDMIGMVNQAFEKHQSLRLLVQEQLQYILVDEYQDTNSAQNQLLLHLTSFWGAEANIFVVGDPNQAIYRFQGASLENTFSFLNHFPQAEVITLTQGYRCPTQLYQVAHDLIAGSYSDKIPDQIKAALSTKLDTQSSVEKPVKLLTAQNTDTAEIWLAKQVMGLVETGTKADQIAILTRTNAIAQQLQARLQSLGVATQLHGGENSLENSLVLQFLQVLEVINSLPIASQQHLAELIRYEWLGFEQQTSYWAIKVASDQQLQIQDMWLMSGEELHQLQPALASHTWQEWLDLGQEFHWLYSKIPTVGLRDWLAELMRVSQLGKYLKNNEQSAAQVAAIQSVFKLCDQIVADQPNARLGDLLKQIAIMNQYNISLSPSSLTVAESKVQIMTAHRAKGLEWQEVFIYGVSDRQWGGKQIRDILPLPDGVLNYSHLSESEFDDDLRLLYVALTRAKHQAWMVFSQTETHKGQDRSEILSRLLQPVVGHPQLETLQIAPSKFEEVVIDSWQSESIPSIELPDLFRQILQNYKLSVSGLNTYLEDPQAFIDSYLLRIPQSSNPHLAFGSAIHQTLEQWNKLLQSSRQHPSQQTILMWFSDFLEKSEIDPAILARWNGKGTEMLKQYYQNKILNTEPPVLIEQFFGYGSRPTVLDGIPLVGRIDAVEWIDQDTKQVRLLDYKSGKPVSANTILGKTKSVELSERELLLPSSIKTKYQRQLAFYHLLTELDSSFTYHVVEGCFEFIESTSAGKLVRRQLALQPQALSDLKDLIREVWRELWQHLVGQEPPHAPNAKYTS